MCFFLTPTTTAREFGVSRAGSQLKTGKRKAIRKQKTDNKCLTCHLEFDGKECQQNCPVCGIIIHTDCLLGAEGCTNCENLNLK